MILPGHTAGSENEDPADSQNSEAAILWLHSATAKATRQHSSLSLERAHSFSLVLV